MILLSLSKFAASNALNKDVYENFTMIGTAESLNFNSIFDSSESKLPSKLESSIISPSSFDADMIFSVELTKENEEEGETESTTSIAADLAAAACTSHGEIARGNG
ncbi:hypothetical protein HAX54_005745, partial [Datura stramonium]|nr:hypothetical protein [Datura stramonium]